MFEQLGSGLLLLATQLVGLGEIPAAEAVTAKSSS